MLPVSLRAMIDPSLWPAEPLDSTMTIGYCLSCHNETGSECKKTAHKIQKYGACLRCLQYMSKEDALTLKLMICLPCNWQKWQFQAREKLSDDSIPDQPGHILTEDSVLPSHWKLGCGSLAIGDIDDVLWGKNKDVLSSMTHIFNCCTERMTNQEYASAFVQKKHLVQILVPMDDSRHFDAIGFLKRRRVTESLVNYLKNGAHVVVFCWAGCNRSALLCVHALMLMGFHVTEAYLMVRRARGCILTNEFFCQQLVWEHAELQYHRQQLTQEASSSSGTPPSTPPPNSDLTDLLSE